MASLLHGARKFYDIPSEELLQWRTEKVSTIDKPIKDILSYIEDNCIGKNTTFSGPYGRRKVVYCDYTASGRSLQFIEDYIRDQVLNHYGNTHTTSTVTSLQTTLYRHEARDIIRNAVNAGEGDAVIFTGSGCTAAVHKLIHALHLQQPPVVFIGPFEHHSNLLPWKEAGAEVVWIAQDGKGLVDLKDLEDKLKTYATTGKQLIGCFAAASNVTGILIDTNAISACLHRYGALACWDYATAGPYVEINMNPLVTSDDQTIVYKDAVFISAHKFVGGVGTPGILVAKKKLFKNPVPSGGGGGTVFYVTEHTHRYLKEIEMREEGGTPAIVESIRAGLVFQLKEAVGHDLIMTKEEELCSKALSTWSCTDNLVLLGSTSVPRLPIFSFLIKHPASGLFLHYNFVCALLNDLFGIQARGGCACAGPYAQDLLGMDEELAMRIETLLLEDSRLDRVHLRRYNEYSEREILRPGFVRLNLPYFMSDDCVQFVIKAVEMVAEEGWKLLPQYMFNPETGEWKHRRHKVFRDRKWLGSITYSSGQMTYPSTGLVGEEPPENLQECLSTAEVLFNKAGKTTNVIGDQTLLLGQEGEALRWFVLPSEAADILAGKSPAHLPKSPPFTPRIWNTLNSVPKVRNIEGAGSVSGLGNANGPLGTTSEFEDACVLSQNGPRTECCEQLASRDSQSDAREVPKSSNCCKKKGNGICLEDEVKVCENKGFFEDPIDHGNTISVKENVNLRKSDTPETNVAASDQNRNSRKGKMVNRSKENSEYEDISSARCKTCPRCRTKQGDPEPESNRRKDKVTLQTEHSVQELETNKTLDGKESNSNVNNQKETNKLTAGEPTNKPKFHHPPKSIFKPTVQALEEYSMLADGDRVLVCLSGGKDSLSLLHTLRQYQYQAKAKGIKFEIGAATVDPQSSAYDPRPLVPYLAALGVPYFFEEQGIIQQASQLPVIESICSFCSRMKRGRLYACARREGYNVLAMGQHLDDLAESFLMSAFHNGLLRTMKANYTVQEDDLRVIRPFVYVREKDLREFAGTVKLPVIAENCPACFDAPKERHRTKQLLAAQELLFPDLYHSMLTAMKPLMARNRVGLESTKMKAGDYGDFL